MAKRSGNATQIIDDAAAYYVNRKRTRKNRSSRKAPQLSGLFSHAIDAAGELADMYGKPKLATLFSQVAKVLSVEPVTGTHPPTPLDTVEEDEDDDPVSCKASNLVKHINLSSKHNLSDRVNELANLLEKKDNGENTGH